MPKTPSLNEAQAVEFNNRLATEVVSKIVNETLECGGTIADVLVACESVVVGVIFECLKQGLDAKPGAPEAILDALTTRLRERLAEAAQAKETAQRRH